MSIKDKYTVEPVPRSEYKDWILKKHYAKRMPSISYAFGLFDDKKILQGVCTFGTPCSSTLLKGVCGEKYTSIVKELNRLVMNQIDKNQASYFIGKCFYLLPQPLIIVSYADTSKNHSGYIYQATNWIYTGLSSKFIDPKVEGLENQHHGTYAHGLSNKELKDKYGDKLYFESRPQKHRYIYFLGDKRQKREMIEALKYKIQPYPKGDNKNYDASYKPDIQTKLF